MLTLLGMAGGAAAVRLLNRKQKPVDVEELERQKSSLKQLVKQLEKEAANASKESVERQIALHQLRQEAETLQSKIEELASKNSELEEEVSSKNSELGSLQATAEQFRAANEDLQREQASMASANEELVAKVAALKVEHELSVKELQGQLEDLRARVSAVVTRMLSRSISDAEAADAVRALGLEIEYIEAPPSAVKEAAEAPAAAPPAKAAISWVGQTSLLLDDRQRIERLVVSGMMRNLEAAPDSATAKIPMVTFPSRVPSSGPKNTKATPAALDNGHASASQDVGGGGSRDQHPLPAPSAPAAAKGGAASKATHPAPAIAMSTPPPKPPKGSAAASNAGIQFVYSLQGGKGSSWVAKVPVSGEASSPAAYLSSNADSPGSMLGGPGMGGSKLGHGMMDSPLNHARDLIARSS